MYHRKSGWLIGKNKDSINKIIINKLAEEGEVYNPFLATDINTCKLKIIKKLTEKLNLEMIFGFINEGDLTIFNRNAIPYFSDAHIKAANILISIAQRCAIQIIADEIKKEYGKYLLLKEIVECDIVVVITDLFILLFYYDI